MKLSEFLKAKNWSQSKLARELDVTPATISYWLKGVRIPRAKQLAALQKLSGGKIKPVDFFEVENDN